MSILSYSFSTFQAVSLPFFQHGKATRSRVLRSILSCLITDPAIGRTIAGHSDVQNSYIAVQIAEQLNVSEATIRNRWFQWIAKVVPEPLLKQDKNHYTQLDLELFSQFAAVKHCELTSQRWRYRKSWVTEAKARYSQEWASALLHLQFPQSYEAVSARFGFPAYRDSHADYYQLPNGRWAAIQYAGTTATGFQFSDSDG